MRCEASAPAKVIIGGEHWVVSGAHALAAAVGLRARAFCEALGASPVARIVSRGFGEAIVYRDHVRCSDDRLCGLARMIREVGVFPAVCRVESEIPVGAGLGSSAAAAVALAAAYLGLRGSEPGLEEVNRAAFLSEEVVHGKPSGIDNTVSVHGGFILFRRGGQLRVLKPRLPRSVRIAIVDTGIPRSTKVAVDRFQSMLSTLGVVGEKLLGLADDIVKAMAVSIEEGDVAGLGRLMYVSHGLLQAMGVSHPLLDTIVHIAREGGALGAKLTGAGMGGVAIVVYEEDREAEVVGRLRGAGFRVIESRLGVKGVSVSCSPRGR